MPNHVHMIIVINDIGRQIAAPTEKNEVNTNDSFYRREKRGEYK